MARRELACDGALDIECAAWDRPVVAALYSDAGASTYRSLDDAIDTMAARGGTWWTWGGGRYDLLAVADRLKERGTAVQCAMAGSAVTRMVGAGIELRDACALVPMSLSRAATMAGLAAPRNLGWPCVCGEACGGYCRITTALPPGRWRQLADYCAHDAEVCYRVVRTVLGRLRALGIEPRGTIGGTAWATAQSWLGIRPVEWRNDDWRHVRQSYYGGRVTVARPRAASGRQYDLSGAYPAALAATPLPVGDPVRCVGRRAAASYRRGLPGSFLARVTVPRDAWLPPLPVRDESERTYYPIGKIRSWWTGLELRAAEERGVKVAAIEESIVWPDGSAVIFDAMIRTIYGHRLAAGKESAWGAWWRLMANSLTGKFAEQPLKESIQICPPGTPRYCSPDDERSRAAGCTARYCTGRCGCPRQLDTVGRIWAQPYYRISDSAAIHWAAHLTAATRITWLAGAERVATGLVYGDTDSIWCADGAPAPGVVGDDLGQWSDKGAWSEWHCRGPKAYRFTDGAGAGIVRVSGIGGVSDADWAELDVRDRALHSDRGVQTLREAAPSGDLFRRRYRERRLPLVTGWYGDRRLDDFTGLTYPATYGEAKAERDKRNR